MKHALLDYFSISKSGLFDEHYYLLNNPDVRGADVDPVIHFIRTGWKEFRDPSESFSVVYYLDSNPDVKASGVNPLVHYIRYGKAEGRLPLPPAESNVEASEKGVTVRTPSRVGGYNYAPTKTSKKPKSNSVSIIIPTRNGGKLFEQTLKALASQEYAGEIEIVIIDTESEDGTPALAEKYGAKVIPITKSKFNHGLTRNQAVESSSGEILVFLSQDSIPGDEHYLTNITSAFADPLVAGSYARQVPREDADIFTKRDLNQWLTSKTQPEVRWIKDFDAYEHMPPADKYLFCNFDDVASAMRRSVWQAIPFAKNDFGEDIEWSMNALEAGWKIAYAPEAFVIHSHNKTFKYEYSRNVLAHEKLYSQFGLWTIPTLKVAGRSIRQGITTESTYAREHIMDRAELNRMLNRVPGLVIAGVIGQYRGANLARKRLDSKGKN